MKVKCLMFWRRETLVFSSDRVIVDKVSVCKYIVVHPLWCKYAHLSLTRITFNIPYIYIFCYMSLVAWHVCT